MTINPPGEGLVLDSASRISLSESPPVSNQVIGRMLKLSPSRSVGEWGPCRILCADAPVSNVETKKSESRGRRLRGPRGRLPRRSGSRLGPVASWEGEGPGSCAAPTRPRVLAGADPAARCGETAVGCRIATAPHRPHGRRPPTRRSRRRSRGSSRPGPRVPRGDSEAGGKPRLCGQPYTASPGIPPHPPTSRTPSSVVRRVAAASERALECEPGVAGAGSAGPSRAAEARRTGCAAHVNGGSSHGRAFLLFFRG